MGNKSTYGYTRKEVKCPICERSVNGKRPIMKVDGTWVHVSCHALKRGLANA